MSNSYHPTRRGFLRSAVASAALAPALMGFAQTPASEESDTTGPDSALLSQIDLDRELYEQDGIVNGMLRFLRPVTSPTQVEWSDSFGRVAARVMLPPSSAATVALPFSFNLRFSLTYVNWVRVKVNGVPQAATAKFLVSPQWTPWDDYHNIMWAHYPDGFYGLLRKAGVDATITAGDNGLSPILNNNFDFYVEQMAWEVFSIYHKDQALWRGLIEKFSLDRNNLELWVRNPCINDPETDKYIHDRLSRFARERRAFRPLYYNIADELGQGDQIRPNDFCHSKFCAEKFTEYLSRQSGGGIRPHGTAKLADLTGTTTDRAFEAIALAAIRAKYKTIEQFNQEWGTSFPGPAHYGDPQGMVFSGALMIARESLSAPTLDAASLEKAMGPLDLANIRWGGVPGFFAPDRPTRFQNWDQVVAFVNRYYKELGEVASTEGWNVSSWCVFRNFMDETFADAVKRAADVCKAEDPHALCATEGGQAPFAFGWYNYEQVVRAVDVIEPYNIGECVEVIRSLKPEMIMLQTSGTSFTPGQPLTAAQRLRQKRANRPIWWGLFHNHNGTIIWDDNEKGLTFVDERTGKPTPAAEAFSATMLEIRAGLGKLMINCRRQPAAIAIHYSQPSIQIHWLLDNVKHARDWAQHSGGTRDSLGIAVRNSWTKVIEDLSMQYNFVGGKQLEAGLLNAGEYKVFILPQSIAMSAKEAEQIRAFVQNGGTLVADMRVAELDEHGRENRRGRNPQGGHGGHLDDLFGIAHGPAQSFAKSVQGTGSEGALHLEGNALREIRPGDATVVTTTGKALAHSGNVPMVIVNQVGSGRAIFLNMEIADYAYLRLQPNSNSSFPDLVEDILAWAEVTPPVRVLAADGKRLPGTEVVTFSNGSCEQVAVFRNPQTDSGGWGSYPSLVATGSAPVIDPAIMANIDNSLLEKEAEITLEWPEERQAYDVRGRKDLGKIRTLKATLDPWSALVFTRSSQPISALRADVAPNSRAGEMVEITLTDESPVPEGTVRTVHFEFKTPGGDVYDLYSRNVLVRATPYVERVPFAVNDPKGRWHVTAHDLMTGHVVDTTFDLA
ncbi:MAG: beta-galactosidase trimerization domain-containing protein [Acidobacteriaceae bacterium]